VINRTSSVHRQSEIQSTEIAPNNCRNSVTATNADLQMIIIAIIIIIIINGA
jgi:hypothetical protein